MSELVSSPLGQSSAIFNKSFFHLPNAIYGTRVSLTDKALSAVSRPLTTTTGTWRARHQLTDETHAGHKPLRASAGESLPVPRQSEVHLVPYEALEFLQTTKPFVPSWP